MKRTGYLRGVLVLSALICAFACPAQHRERLPDSLSTSEDNLPAAADTSPADSTETSTTGSVVTDSSSTTVSPDSARGDTTTPATLPIVLRSVPDSVIRAYKNEKDFAYANDPAYWMKERERKDEPNGFWFWLYRLLDSSALRILVYMALGALLIFALYKIISENELHLFYRRSRTGSGRPGMGDGTDAGEEDLDRKIQEAMQGGDYRLATRYLFLNALRLMREGELIQYQPEATNQEYILQMAGHAQGSTFRFLAGAYEYVWYGDFALSREQFDHLSRNFQDFYKNIVSRN